MELIKRLQDFQGHYVFMRWATGNDYGKIEYVGDDFVEFSIIDVDTMDYKETILINSQLILEMTFGGSDVARILAERSSKLS